LFTLPVLAATDTYITLCSDAGNAGTGHIAAGNNQVTVTVNNNNVVWRSNFVMFYR